MNTSTDTKTGRNAAKPFNFEAFLERLKDALTGDQCAELGIYDLEEYMEANTKVIVASPAMLKALQDVVEDFSPATIKACHEAIQLATE